MRNFRLLAKETLKGVGFGLLLSLGIWAFCAVALSSISVVFVRDWELLTETITKLKSDPDLSRPLVSIPCAILLFVVTVRFLIRTPWYDKYLEALSTTPWQAGKTLPGGPIQFGAGLWAMLISATLFGNLLLGIDWWVFPTTAFSAHAILSAIFLFRSDRYWGFSYGVATPLQIWLIHFYDQPYFPLAFLATMYWATVPMIHKTIEDRLNSPVTKPENPKVIWPVTLQNSTQNLWSRNPQRQKYEWFLQSILIGMIAYGFYLNEIPPVITFSIFLVGFLIKTLVFLWTKQPPVSLIGRLRKGPLVIPKYDRVFLPLIIATASFPIALVGLQIIPEHWAPQSTGLIGVLATIAFLKLFPSRDYWTYLAPGKAGQQPPTGNQEYKRI